MWVSNKMRQVLGKITSQPTAAFWCFPPAAFNPICVPLTCLLLVFQNQCHVVLLSPLKTSEAIHFEQRLALPRPRWSSKCGWMESCGSSAACPRRRPARTWSLLWPRPSVSVSNPRLLFFTVCKTAENESGKDPANSIPSQDRRYYSSQAQSEPVVCQRLLLGGI